MNIFVAKIQRLLNALGYPVKNTDGVFDKTTKAMMSNIFFDYGVEDMDVQTEKDALDILEAIYISNTMFELYEGLEEVFE